MVSRILYKDFFEDTVAIAWYNVKDSDSTVYDFQCAGEDPLIFDWHGDIYKNVIGSEITFYVLITNDQDKQQLDEVLNGHWFVNVSKLGNIIWTGRLFPKYFIEPYRPYPYVVELNASDQLGLSKERQMLMIDFPEPFIPTAPEYSLIDIFNKVFVSSLFKPDNSTTQPTSPDEIRVASTVYVDGGNHTTLFEDIYLDPLVFMDDENQYISFNEMLGEILKPLDMTIFQQDNIWYIISKDAQKSANQITYRSYTVDSGGPIFNGEVTEGFEIVKPYELRYDEDKQYRSGATIEYLPSLGNLIFNKQFQQNINILQSCVNRKGDFYEGHNGVVLENEHPTNDTDVNLRHWDRYGNITAYNTEYYENTGWVFLPVRQNYSQNDRWEKVIQVDTTGINGFTVGWSTNRISRIIDFAVELKIDYKGTTWWFWYNDTEDRYEWVDTFRTWLGKATSDFEVDTGLPNNETSTTEALTLTFNMQGFVHNDWVADTWQWIYGVRVGVNVCEWDCIDYEEETKIIDAAINPDGDKLKLDMDFTWGIVKEGLLNTHDIHYSAPYDVNGNVVNYFRREGANTPNQSTLLDILRAKMTEDYFSYSKILKANIRSRRLSPLAILIDYEGTAYRMLRGEYHDKMQNWQGEWVEFKQFASSGDFNNDFNNDFYL